MLVVNGYKNRNDGYLAQKKKRSVLSFGSVRLVEEKFKNRSQELTEDEKSFLIKKAQNFPQDINYKKNLLTNLGKNPEEYYRLSAIMGPKEIEYNMSIADERPDFFSTGINDENIISKKLGASTHIHTEKGSDGFMSVKDILDQGRKYADKIALNRHQIKDKRTRAFITGITDHDSVEALNEMIELIYQNPLKYKNLGVMLGIELTTFNDIKKIFPDKINVHTLAYGVDPNEVGLNDFLEMYKVRKSRLNYESIQDANSIYKKTFSTDKGLFSKEEAENFYSPLKKHIIGTYNYLRSYIETKMLAQEVVANNGLLTEMLSEKGIKSNSESIMQAMQQYFYQINRNNKAGDASSMMSEFVSKTLEIEDSEAKALLKQTAISSNYSDFKKEFRESFKKFSIDNCANPKYLPDVSEFYKALQNQPDVPMGIAHPLEQCAKIELSKPLPKRIMLVNDMSNFMAKARHLLLKNKNENTVVTIETIKQVRYLKELYKMFKISGKEKAKFSEVYYQSYKEGLKNVQENPSIKQTLKNLSKKLKMFKFGGFDCHRNSIFRRYV